MRRLVLAVALVAALGISASVALRGEDAEPNVPDRIASVSRVGGTPALSYYFPLDFYADATALNPNRGLPGITTFCALQPDECSWPPSWPPETFGWVVSTGSLTTELVEPYSRTGMTTSPSG